MIEHYYNKNKVLWHYATSVVIGIVSFMGILFQVRKLNHVYIYGPFILYGLWIVASVVRRVLYKKPVITITSNRLIIDRINLVLYHRPVVIMFDEIKYMSTDMLKGTKIFFLKTKTIRNTSSI
jgi:hypothetical protein